MHPDVQIMTVTTERQLLSGKAARGWEVEQAHIDAGIVRSLLGRAVQAVNRIQAVRTAAVPLTGQSDRQGGSPFKRLMDMLPTE